MTKFNLEKLQELAKPRSEEALQAEMFRMENREWLRMSQDIALTVRYYLKAEGLHQKDLADRLGVSPAYVAKLMKGQENLTLETIGNIQRVLDVELIHVVRPYENIRTYEPAEESVSSRVAEDDPIEAYRKNKK